MVNVVYEFEARNLITDHFKSMTIDDLAILAWASIEGGEKGWLTCLGLADELEQRYGEKFMVIPDHDGEAYKTAKVLYGN